MRVGVKIAGSQDAEFTQPLGDKYAPLENEDNRKVLNFGLWGPGPAREGEEQ